MSVLKRIGLIFAIITIAGMNIFFYWNSHFYYKGKSKGNVEKIDFLERSNKFCPLNDQVFYELGKAYLDLGLENVSDPRTSETHLRNSVKNLRQSIRVNPAYPYSHYYLGQALLQLDQFAPGSAIGFFDEFKKAVRLAGEDIQIHREVSRVFLSRWTKLSAEDREFTIDILKRTMAKSNPDQIVILLNIWEMNPRDYEIMNKVLPQDPKILRMYAQFLGEKSLALEERQKALAQAEFLEFEAAQRESRLGETGLFNYGIKDAFGHFRGALDLLNNIRFYQTLRFETLISSDDFAELLKSTWLNLARCRVEEGAGLDEVARYLRPYLAMEEQPRAIGDLETLLRNRGVLPPALGGGFDDLGGLAFELLLQYEQTRYRDIVGVGRQLEGSFVVVPEAQKKDYVRVLQIIGDATQKIDLIYDAGDIYRKALQAEPGNLETMLRLRQNYDRLNDERKVRELDAAIEKITAPEEIVFNKKRLDKEQLFSLPLIFDGRRVVTELEFESGEGGGQIPLVSIFFNGRVVWEAYLKDKAVSFAVETKVGDNELQVVAVNRAVALVKMGSRSE